MTEDLQILLENKNTLTKPNNKCLLLVLCAENMFLREHDYALYKSHVCYYY